MKDQRKSIWQTIRSFLRGYQREYFDHLYYHNRYFNMKGIASQGAYNIEQPEVYVDVNLAPARPDELIRGVIPQPNSLYQSSRRIWQYLSTPTGNGNKFVIVGSPGSGKTTLLKQIVLAFSRFRRKYDLPRKTPILIFLRTHVPEIVRDPNVKLTEVLRNSLLRGGMQCRESWFERRLQRGQCIVLLDGLDEIGDSEYREKVITWVEKQFAIYPSNHFIVTSRPHGISNVTLAGASILQILPLEVDQIESFIQDWYWATERRLSESDDAGVRIIAREGADDLLSRIQNTDSLQPLARNALLLTMIATLHRFDAQLPGRRVELYDAIFKVFFRRRDVLGIDLLTSEQSKNVLVPLARHMMENRIREICLHDAIKIIQKDLAEIGGEQIMPAEFLHGIQDQSGLLLEVAENEFSFASLTFQEYLASVDYVKGQLVEKLVGEIKSDWWWETIRLFCSQSDGTRIIEACLADEPVQLKQLELAISCLEEALRVEAGVRDRLNEIIRHGVDNPDPRWRNVIAAALLFKRLRFMDRIDARCLIDNSLVTNVEYQVFLDQEMEKGRYFYPDHWNGCRFPVGQALEPVTGVRISDVENFCEWLVPQDIWRFRYRLPKERETTVHKCEKRGAQYWFSESDIIRTTDARRDVSPRYKDLIVQKIISDAEVFTAIRAAENREKTAKPSSELLASVPPVESRASRASLDLASEARIAEVRKGELTRVREWHLLRNFRKFAVRLSIDPEPFLDCVRIVNVTNKDQVQSFDWMPVFPYPPEYGFDLGKEVLEFGKRYPENQLRFMLERKYYGVVHIHQIVSKLLLERSWIRFIDQEEDREDIYDFVRSVARISLLTMAFAGKTRHLSFSCEIANLYLMYCLLERRIAGQETPVEGIRLVKFS